MTTADAADSGTAPTMTEFNGELFAPIRDRGAGPVAGAGHFQLSATFRLGLSDIDFPKNASRSI